MHRGIATMPLDTGRVPAWLFERMKRLTRAVAIVIAEEHGPDEFVKRMSDPVWFQALSCVIGMDWNSSGTTTITTGALKEALRGLEQDLGIFVCGGKGRVSRRTPDEIKTWGGRLALPARHIENLEYNSRMSAKVDSALVQDGFQIYHHSFFFSKNGAWTVVQQGMNTEESTARRYHWHSENINDLVCEPHVGIVSQGQEEKVLNLTAKKSGETRSFSTELVSSGFRTLMKDIELLRRHSSSLSKMAVFRYPAAAHKVPRYPGSAGACPPHPTDQLSLLKLENKEFHTHPVVVEDFRKSRYLEKILWQLCDEKPENYEKLLSAKGVGPKTIRALALVSEIIYGAKPSYEDPARYTFAHGGKDATPYPVDRKTYDQTIETMREVVRKTKIAPPERDKMLKRL